MARKFSGAIRVTVSSETVNNKALVMIGSRFAVQSFWHQRHLRGFDKVHPNLWPLS